MTEVTSAERNLPEQNFHDSLRGQRWNDGTHSAILFPAGRDERKGQNPMKSVTVSAELSLSLVVPEHGAVPLVASLYYCAADPYAIKMAFHVGTDEPVEWIFGRELLASGLVGPAGEGDVQVWPEDAEGADILNIALSSPFGEARFEAPLMATGVFLHSTFDIVPAGAEGEFVNFDGELEQLLWKA